MELNQANRIISKAKTYLRHERMIVLPHTETLGILMLLEIKNSDEVYSTINTNKQSGDYPAQDKKSVSNPCIAEKQILPQLKSSLLFIRLLKLFATPQSKLQYDTNLLCDLHKTLFDGIEQDAGQIRNSDIEKHGASCMSCKLLRASLKTALAQTEKLSTETLIPKADFAAKLCHLSREFLILSPFLVGSELVMHIFLEHYSLENGFILNYYKCSQKELSSAERIALTSDDIQPLFACYIKMLRHAGRLKK